MRKHLNSPIPQYALIACLSIALLFGQMFKLHMHILHSNTSDPGTLSGHVIEVHTSPSTFDQIHDKHSHDKTTAHHHDGEVEVSSDSFVKKVKQLLQFVLLFFTISTIFNLFIKRRTWIKYDFNLKCRSALYLLHPPLRAPPAQFSA